MNLCSPLEEFCCMESNDVLRSIVLGVNVSDHNLDISLQLYHIIWLMSSPDDLIFPFEYSFVKIRVCPD